MAALPAGRLGLRPPPGLSRVSVVFPTVSGLSRRHPPLLLPGCGEQAPGAIAGPDVSLPADSRSGGESEVAIGASVGALFNESEQLGSHERVPVQMSKPISPVVMSSGGVYRSYTDFPE